MLSISLLLVLILSHKSWNSLSRELKVGLLLFGWLGFDQMEIFPMISKELSLTIVLSINFWTILTIFKDMKNIDHIYLGSNGSLILTETIWLLQAILLPLISMCGESLLKEWEVLFIWINNSKYLLMRSGNHILLSKEFKNILILFQELLQ